MSVQSEPVFETVLQERARAVEAMLDELLSSRPLAGEVARPGGLLAAMRHGVLNGGKRLRPFLVIETAELFGAQGNGALRVAAALECVHCYSLIHDDLPAMDNDDVRRGQPTVHRAFGEAAAILAGDSLLTYAFDILADPANDLPAHERAELVLRLARAAGMGGMAGGQSLDLAAEKVRQDEAAIITLQAMKTGALLRFACEAGAIVAGAAEQDRSRLAEFGGALGLAFQLSDDILDVTSTSGAMGKAVGKDEAAGKATLVGLSGLEWARTQLDGLVAEAESLLEPYGPAAEPLRMAARFIASRGN